MVVQIKSGKRENGTSFWDNLYRKRSKDSGFWIGTVVMSWSWRSLSGTVNSEVMFMFSS